MARSKTGEAISKKRQTRKEIEGLRKLLRGADRAGDLKTWRRAKAVLGYIDGKRVIEMAEELEVTRGSINRWLQWFDAQGTDGLRPRKAPGRAPRLTDEQCTELTEAIEMGPQACGYDTGVWTGPMIRDWIKREYSVEYHTHYVPRL